MRFTLPALVAVSCAMAAAASSGLAAQPAGVVRDEELARLDAIFERFAREQHVPGLVYGVVRDGALVHVGAFGVAEIASRREVTVDTVFRIASMTKSFTAVAVLRLRDAGRLSLEAPVASIVPEASGLRHPDRGSPPVRVVHLLGHTAGFVTDDPWGDRQLDMPEADFTRLLKSGVPFAHPTGVAYEYSNFGYALLGRVVARASGERLQDYVTRHVLAPLGMTSTTWEVGSVPAERRAVGYRYEDGDWRAEPVLGDGAFGPMGGLHTSARDYARYVAFLLGAWGEDLPGAERVLAAASRREIARGLSFPRLRPADPRARNACPAAFVYGMGMHVLTDCRFSIALSHSGGLPGYGSYVLLLPEHGVGIFAFANLTYAPVAHAVAEAAATLHDAGLLETRRARAGAPLERAATVTFGCDAGTLEAAVLLAPTLDTRIQRLELAARPERAQRRPEGRGDR